MEWYFYMKICHIKLSWYSKGLNSSKEISIFINEFVYLIILKLSGITDMQKKAKKYFKAKINIIFHRGVSFVPPMRALKFPPLQKSVYLETCVLTYN